MGVEEERKKHRDALADFGTQRAMLVVEAQKGEILLKVVQKSLEDSESR